ncbi:MAG: hypothetical protein HGB00_09005 [Chlorobiaceae bacterium]|nr:hypothetical protein [Chlorobiaceae bacterium]
MNKHDDVYYLERKSTTKHEAYIRNSRNIDDRDFIELVDMVFGHQIAVYEEMSYEVELDVKAISKEFVSSYFYDRCYIPITINKDFEGYPESDIDFCRDVILREVAGIRNRISFLLGPVGSGKTAFINSLITKYGRDWVNMQNIWFVRMDVDIEGNNRLCSVDELVDGLISKIVRVIAKNRYLYNVEHDSKLFECYKNLQAEEQSGELKMMRLQEFVTAFRQYTNRQLFLVIDNLDYLYHINDRVIFDCDNNKEESKALHSVCDLVSAFFHSHLNKLGANVLFVLRTDSYAILKESQKLFSTVPAFTSNMNVYTINPPRWTQVIRQRGHLLLFLISKIKKDGKKIVLSKISRPILEDLNYAPSEQKPLIEHLQHITNFGLRDIMEFFSQYSWLEGQLYKGEQKVTGIERFIHQYPVGLLAFMLKGHRRYNQFKSEFPNIYLVNVKDEFGEKAYQHPHTYWLKRLILHYIRQKMIDGEVVTTTKIVNTFAAQDKNLALTAGLTSVYDEALVRKCLGSLAQAKVSNMISVKRKVSVDLDNLDIEDVELTTRGVYCLENIFDRFFYLQLIVEDYMLPLPRLLRKYYDYPNVDYGYIMEPVSEYCPKAKQMIKKKALQVLLLLEVLEISFECEMLKYETVFKSLSGQGVKMPDINAIKNGVRGELVALVRSQGEFISIKKLFSAIKGRRNSIMEYIYESYSD